MHLEDNVHTLAYNEKPNHHPNPYAKALEGGVAGQHKSQLKRLPPKKHTTR